MTRTKIVAGWLLGQSLGNVANAVAMEADEANGDEPGFGLATMAYRTDTRMVDAALSSQVHTPEHHVLLGWPVCSGVDCSVLHCVCWLAGGTVTFDAVANI